MKTEDATHESSEIRTNEDDNKNNINEKEHNSESLYALYDIQNTSDVSLVSTNLPAGTEDKLKQVLVVKLEKSNDEPSASKSGMFRLNIESGPMSCFYCLLAQPALLTSDTNASEFIHVAAHNALMVVLASPWEGLFELFSLEVENFFSSLQTFGDKKALLEALQDWYSLCIEYITRVPRTLKMKDLATVLEVALHVGEVALQDVPEPLATDLQKFLECCSFTMLDCIPKNKTVMAEFKEKGFTSGPTLSSLSQSWAKDLLASDIPVKVRQTVECYKLKGIQDLNTLKRHMKKAGSDYYELYETYKFLSQSGYPLVLLHLVLKESDVSDEDEEITNLLKENLPCVPPLC